MDLKREQLGWDVDLRAVNTISMLYCMMRSRYMSEDGKSIQKYLVKNSTEKRKIQLGKSYKWAMYIRKGRFI